MYRQDAKVSARSQQVSSGGAGGLYSEVTSAACLAQCSQTYIVVWVCVDATDARMAEKVTIPLRIVYDYGRVYERKY